MLLTNQSDRQDARKTAERLGYRVVYVPHEIIEDYNATYNVIFDGKVVTTEASKAIGVPLNEIWISEMWRSYERFILFHELKEIEHKARGSNPKQAHHKAMQDALHIWKNDPSFEKMVRDIKEMDRRTREKRSSPNY
jgi:competence protein ComEA